jgi:hypothetical protein
MSASVSRTAAGRPSGLEASFSAYLGPAWAAARLARTVGVMKPTRVGPGRRYLPGSPFNTPVIEEPAETYEQSDLVTHDKYGLGSVLEVDGETAIVIDFGTRRMRLALPCAKLFKL